jgi:NADPH:quinone reductase-like Zn-dependent oxidoreductase
MRQFQYTSNGSAYQLSLLDVPEQTLGPSDVKIRVHASSLNYRDLMTLRKEANRNVEGIVPLSDGAGEIVEVGSEVTNWKAGDRVAGCFFQRWLFGRFDLAHHQYDLGGGLSGMLAEYVVLHQDGVVRIPTELSFEDAASMPCAGVTAWYALVSRGAFQAGDSVLLLGTGGVSIFALQIAASLGGRVIITSSSDEKLARAKVMGADAGINYRTIPDWEKEVWRLTDKRGVDHVIEVGGQGTLNHSVQCAAASGHIAMIGVLTGVSPTSMNLFPLLVRNLRVNGIYVGPRMAFEELLAFYAQNHLRPVIDSVFDFKEAASAFKYLATGRHFGKIVIRHN